MKHVRLSHSGCPPSKKNKQQQQQQQKPPMQLAVQCSPTSRCGSQSFKGSVFQKLNAILELGKEETTQLDVT